MQSGNDPRDARYAPDSGFGDGDEYGDGADDAREPAYARDPGYADPRYAADHDGDGEYAGAYERDQAFASRDARPEVEYAGVAEHRGGRYAGERDVEVGPARGVEYSRSRTGRTTMPTRNGGRDTYSGYPTAARLLGIAPPTPAGDFDDEPEPGKWERSGRLQSWLEDAEQSSSSGRVVAAEEVEELEAGVMPARAMQARRMPTAPLRPVTRNNARKALPWERRAAEDGYPQFRPAQSGRRLPPALIATFVLLVAAAVLFALPSMLPLVAGRPRQAVSQPTARPTPAAVVAPATPEPEATEAPPAAPTPRIYRVRAGDNLVAIAQRYDVTVREILTANPDVTDPAQIKIGQRLTIPDAESP